MNITYLLVLMQRIGKMHEQKLKELCRQYDLSLIEAKIIAFLHNNPTKDTAGDIVELRMLSKGNVSQAVDLLCQKGLLSKTADPDGSQENASFPAAIMRKCYRSNRHVPVCFLPQSV